MIAAHENSNSDAFVTSVFDMFESLCKDPLFGMNKFDNQKKVQEISNSYLLVVPPPEPSDDHSKIESKDKEETQEYYLENSPMPSPHKSPQFGQRSEDGTEERQKFKDVETTFQDWICSGRL